MHLRWAQGAKGQWVGTRMDEHSGVVDTSGCTHVWCSSAVLLTLVRSASPSSSCLQGESGMANGYRHTVPQESRASSTHPSATATWWIMARWSSRSPLSRRVARCNEVYDDPEWSSDLCEIMDPGTHMSFSTSQKSYESPARSTNEPVV